MFAAPKTTGAIEVKIQTFVDVTSFYYHTKFDLITLYRYGDIASILVHTQSNGLIPFLFSIPCFCGLFTQDQKVLSS